MGLVMEITDGRTVKCGKCRWELSLQGGRFKYADSSILRAEWERHNKKMHA